MDHQNHDSQIARYIDLVFDTFLELRGDRKSGDDRSIIGGLARLDGRKVVVIGYQQGKFAETPQVLRPAGYRKCSRLIHLAKAFSKPVIAFIDVFEVSSLAASEQQQVNEALSRSLKEMYSLMTPIICIIADEYSSIAAANICAADRFLILKDAQDPAEPSGETSADKMHNGLSCLNAQGLLRLNTIYKLVKKPDDIKLISHIMKEVILEELDLLGQIHPEALVRQRLDRLQYQFLGFKASQPLSGNSDEAPEN